MARSDSHPVISPEIRFGRSHDSSDAVTLLNMSRFESMDQRRFTASPQRLVRRSRAFVALPMTVFILLLCVLSWEIVRMNIDPVLQSQWPWRLKLLGVAPSATLAGVAGSLLLARNQFARSVRPSLGGAGDTLGAGKMMGKRAAWTVYFHNGGPGLCVITGIAYRVTFSGDGESNIDHWVSLPDVYNLLSDRGLKRDVDYAFQVLGIGAPLPPGRSSDPKSELMALSTRALSVIQGIDMRVRVTDIAGDSHERTIRCLQAAPLPAHGSGWLRERSGRVRHWWRP